MKFNPLAAVLALAHLLHRWLLWHRRMLTCHGRTYLFFAFLAGVAMSYCDRALAATLHAEGVTPWMWLQEFRNSLRVCGWRADGLGADLANGITLSAVVFSGPPMLFFLVYGLYAVLLWTGGAVAVFWIAPRLTNYPNLDLLIWPILAGVIHAAIVTIVLKRLEHRGHGQAAKSIKHLGSALGLFAAALGLAIHLVPSLTSLLMIAQLSVEWLLS